MPIERIAPIRPVLPLIRQKLLLHKPINRTSTVSAVCLQIRARVAGVKHILKGLALMKRGFRHPVTPHKTKTLVYTDVILVPKIRLVPLLCNLGGF